MSIGDVIAWVLIVICTSCFSVGYNPHLGRHTITDIKTERELEEHNE